jgi:hypothetical protein
MPFAVFRRHSKKLLAVFAILAMVGFVLSDSLPALMRATNESHRTDPEIAHLYGKPVRRTDLDVLYRERSLSNAFMANLMGRLYGGGPPQFFGDTDIRGLVDAFILQHEADRLGMPGGPELARRWLTQNVGAQLNAEMFELVLAPFRNQNNVTGEEMLAALGNQIRLLEVRVLPGLPEVTPLDVYEAYRERYEQFQLQLVKLPTEEFLGQVSDPTSADLQTYYDRYKDVLPAPLRRTPGFKIPRQAQVEYAVADGSSLAAEIRAKLTDAEVLEYYNSRKHEPLFTLPPLPAMPAAIFADDTKNALTPLPKNPADASPELVSDTSPRYRPLDEVRAQLLIDLSEEKAREVVDRKFNPVRDLMLEYADRYSEAVEDNRDAKRRGEPEKKPKPPKPSLRAAAEKEGLVLVTTPLLSRDAAAREPRIGSAKVGVSPQSEGRSFADEMFSSAETLFEPVELVNDVSQFFLAWKIADNPPRVPPLSEVRAEVVRAWKLEQARPKAVEAAQSLAEQVRKAGGKLTPELVGERPILTTGPLTLLETAMLPVPGQFAPPKPRPSLIPEIPDASEKLRQNIFDIEPGQVIVESDQPQSTMYVITLLKRYPASYATLYAPYGPRMSLQYEVAEEARQRRLESWLASLRAEAGLKADWSPPEDAEPRSPRRRG